MNIEKSVEILKEFRNYNKFYKEENRDLTITITLEEKESIDKAIERLLTAYEKEKEENKKLEKQIEAKVMNNYISKDKIAKTFDNYSESSLMLNNTFIEFEKDLLGEEYWQY